VEVVVAKRKSTPWTEEQGRAEVAAWLRSGETIGVYTARTGVSVRRLGYWQSRLSLAAKAHAPPRLIEVTFASPPRVPTAVEVTFPAGHVVKVVTELPLAELLRAVGELAC
jgi:hypothetical protein